MKEDSLQHIAIIMDGNGRWAKKRGKPHIYGHRQGAQALKNIIEESVRLGLKFLTVYAFSTENWDRPAPEVRGLMALLKRYLKKETQSLHEKNIRICFIGGREKFDADILDLMQDAESLTQHNTGLTFVVALSYGARQEIMQAIRCIVEDVSAHKVQTDQMTPEIFQTYLYTAGIPDPDLIIRTSGEQRISNFLLWQLAYAEFYFTPVLWPDFSKEDLCKAMDSFYGRERRFGLVSAQVTKREGQ